MLWLDFDQLGFGLLIKKGILLVDSRLLRSYEKWVTAGKPAELIEDLATAVTTPIKLSSATTPKLNNTATITRLVLPTAGAIITTETPPHNLAKCNCDTYTQLGPKSFVPCRI